MWYETLPSMLIIATMFAVPQIASYYINDWVFGNPMRRKLEHKWDRHMTIRDERVSGAVWNIAGLEQIPDQ